MRACAWLVSVAIGVGLALASPASAEAPFRPGRDREEYYRERAAAWVRTHQVAPLPDATQSVVVRRTTSAPAPRLNLPQVRAGTGSLRDSGRVGTIPRDNLSYFGPGFGTLNGLGNANGGTGIGGGSTGTGVDSGTNAGADVVRPLPRVGNGKAKK